eukprot:1195900-Prorocentrum_minimum.AAC.4
MFTPGHERADAGDGVHDRYWGGLAGVEGAPVLLQAPLPEALAVLPAARWPSDPALVPHI